MSRLHCSGPTRAALIGGRQQATAGETSFPCAALRARWSHDQFLHQASLVGAARAALWDMAHARLLHAASQQEQIRDSSLSLSNLPPRDHHNNNPVHNAFAMHLLHDALPDPMIIESTLPPPSSNASATVSSDQLHMTVPDHTVT
jgi:hypothetical protein